MNLYRLSVIALRIAGIDLLLNVPVRLISAAGEVLSLFHPQTNYFQTRAEISIIAFLARLLLDAGAGVWLIAWSRPCARLFTKSLTPEMMADESMQGVWPPPPRQPLPTGATRILSRLDNAGSIGQVASLLLKVNGVTWLLSTVFEATYLPVEIFGAVSYRSGYWKSQYVLGVTATALAILFSLAIGLYLLFFSDPLAHRITQDLVRDAETDASEQPAVPRIQPAAEDVQNLP